MGAFIMAICVKLRKGPQYLDATGLGLPPGLQLPEEAEVMIMIIQCVLLVVLDEISGKCAWNFKTDKGTVHDHLISFI